MTGLPGGSAGTEKVLPAPERDRLRVSVLGPVRAWLGDREVDLGQARQRSLFALLATACGRFVGRAELIEGIWGSSPPSTAVGSIHTYVSGLRRSLRPVGRELLTSKSSAYALDLDPADLDSERFARLVSDAAQLRAAGEPKAAAARLAEGLGLWCGEAYAGLSSEGLLLERTRLQERRLAAMESRARLLLELGDTDLIAELAVLVSEHPLHEPLPELLMLALHKAGRRAEALEVFRSASRTLSTELGVEPGPALRELHRTLTSGPSDQQAALLPPPPVHMRSGQEPAEAELLRELVRNLGMGAGAALWIEGNTDLTAAFGDTECQIAWATADELDRHMPLQVLARALGWSATGVDQWALARHVEACCQQAPLLLVVDGLHWADDESLQLWKRLIAASRRLPLLLVATTRPDTGRSALDLLRHRVIDRKGHVLSLSAPDDRRPVSVTGGTRDVLQRLALLGNEFTTEEALAVTGRPAFDLVSDIEEAISAGVLTGTGATLTFTRTPHREALYASIPPEQRAHYRRQAAEALQATGTPMTRVAAQLAAEAPAIDDWVVAWVVEHHAKLLDRAPTTASLLIHAVLDRGSLEDSQRTTLLGASRLPDAVAESKASQPEWQTATGRRDHERALAIVDGELDRLRHHDQAAAYFDLLENRMFTLHCLDRLDEADRTLRDAALFAIGHGLPVRLRAASAIQSYWRGRWDDVLAAVSEDTPSDRIALHGIAAVVAARRGDAALAEELVVAVEDCPAGPEDHESPGFLTAARALVAEQFNDPDLAIGILRPLLTPGPDPLLPRHIWLPDGVRLAIRLGRTDFAEQATAVCMAEAKIETHPARAHMAALRCQALLTVDAEPALTAAAQNRTTGHVVDRAAALEDAAVLLASGRNPDEAARAGTEACATYAALGARWDLDRAERRLAEYGITVGPQRDTWA
jgi:DNA-binding SARP family transcriptional activator